MLAGQRPSQPRQGCRPAIRLWPPRQYRARLALPPRQRTSLVRDFKCETVAIWPLANQQLRDVFERGGSARSWLMRGLSTCSRLTTMSYGASAFKAGRWCPSH